MLSKASSWPIVLFRNKMHKLAFLGAHCEFHEYYFNRQFNPEGLNRICPWYKYLAIIYGSHDLWCPINTTESWNSYKQYSLVQIPHVLDSVKIVDSMQHCGDHHYELLRILALDVRRKQIVQQECLGDIWSLLNSTYTEPLHAIHIYCFTCWQLGNIHDTILGRSTYQLTHYLWQSSSHDVCSSDWEKYGLSPPWCGLPVLKSYLHNGWVPRKQGSLRNGQYSFSTKVRSPWSYKPPTCISN